MLNTRIIIVLVLFTVFLCSMIALKQRTLITGTPVLLETEPIDPRSLFRGDYVRLNYIISRLRPSELKGDDKFERHDKVFVELQQHGKYWHPIAIYQNHLKSENIVHYFSFFFELSANFHVFLNYYVNSQLKLLLKASISY